MAVEVASSPVNGIDVSYAHVGDPNASFAIVFLPGPTDSWLSYEPVLRRLPPSVRAIAVSQRGHGDSEKPPGGYGIGDFASDAVELLAALGIDRAVVAGHSGSCFTARRIALDRPDVVAGLVLEASPLTLKDDPGLRGFVTSVVETLDDPIDPEFARSFIVDTSSEATTASAIDVLVDELLKVPTRVWKEVFASLLAYDDVEELGGIVAPALLIWGEADQLVGRAAQDELVHLLQGATLLTYPGVGHTPRWEQPARFVADVVAFTDSLRR